MRYYYTKLADKILSLTILSFGKDMEQLEFSYTIWEYKLIQPIWKTMTVSSRVENNHPLWLRNFTPRIYFRDLLLYVHQDTHTRMFRVVPLQLSQN